MTDHTPTRVELVPNKKIKKIGVFLGWRDPAYGAYHAAKHFGASIVCCFSCKSYSELAKDLKDHELDGYVFICPDEQMCQFAEILNSEGIPVCVVLRETKNVPCITTNTQALTSDIVDYFVSMGHRKIAIITGTQNEQGRVRLQGYLDGLKKNNLPVNKELIIDFGAVTSKDPHSKYDKLHKFLSEKHEFTAMVIGGRWGILSLLNAASDYGYKIPEDFATFTIDDPCEFPGVKEWISHAPLPAYQLGWEAVKMVCENIDSPPTEVIRREFPGRMVIRNSCGGRRQSNDLSPIADDTSPLAHLQETLEQTFPKYFGTDAKRICKSIEDIVLNHTDKDEALFDIILEIEDHGFQHDRLASICAMIQRYAQEQSRIGPKDLDAVFQRVYQLISKRLIEYNRPKDFQCPGQPRIDRFYPQTVGKTHSFKSTIEELKRQLSNRKARKIVLKLDPIEDSANKLFFWEYPVDRFNLQQSKTLHFDDSYPLTEFTSSKKPIQSLFLDFEIERQGHQWIYLEIDPEECFQCLELLFQFANGYQTFQTYAEQRRNSIALENAKREAISSQKQAELALQSARTIDQAKNNFLAGMSHEIRTPMSNIIGLTELISETKLNLQQRKRLEMVQSSMASLIGITDEILNFSSIESGEIQLEKTEFDLRATLSNLTQSIAFRAEEKGLELKHQIQPEIPNTLVGDPNRLRQILLNLIGNAIKFTNSGYVSINLAQVRANEKLTKILFKISDSGIGIPADKRDHIFESFEQADSSTTRRYGGTGLGLTICKRLIEHMGSKLVIDSVEGKGSVFSFQIEFEHIHDETNPELKSPSNLNSMPKVNILVIESDPVDQRTFETTLNEMGANPTFATNALSGFGELIRAKNEGNEYDCLIIDSDLSGLSGYELIRQINGSNAYQGKIIVMIPGSAQQEETKGLQELNITDFITKPINGEDLKTKLLKTFESDKKSKSETTESDTLPTSNKKGPSKALNILLVEDNLVNVAVVTGFLENRGHTIIHVDNGLDATKASAETDFDLILMDIQMPIMDGLEATRRIREMENETGRKTRIIAMTARAMEGDQDECLSTGMDGYVSKPFKKESLIKAVEAEA